ncbi:MAG TPA: hypothetical protein VFZ02_05115 [Ktedonobacteraceae bacterium]
MEHYYTSEEARQHLGMHVGAFYYLIETGKIKRLTPPGKKRGLYSKQQIERLKCPTGEGEPGPTFMKATPDDIYEEYELATLMLNGSAAYGVPTYTAWLGKNPETNFIVRDQGRLVAFMLVLPVKQRTIKRWINGEIREWEIGAEDVLPYIPTSSVECIMMSMATTADVDTQKRRQYGLCLIRGFLHFLHELAEQDITITRFYAISATPEGNAMLRQAGFEERGHIGKRMGFELNPLASGTRLAQAYRAVLKRNNDGNGAPRMRDDNRVTQTRTMPCLSVL